MDDSLNAQRWLRGIVGSVALLAIFFYATAIVTLAVIASVFLKEVPIRAPTPAERRQVADAEQREEVPSFGG